MPTPKRARRYAVAVLPHLPVQRLGLNADTATPPPRLLALAVTVRGRREITAVSPEAWRVGARPGMTVTEAQAAWPTLAVEPHDAAADHREWQRLARWMYCYSPLAGWLAAPPERHAADPFAVPALWIDSAGTELLHGSEATLAARIQAELAAQGYTTYLGVADTPWAARAVALHAAVEDAPAATSEPPAAGRARPPCRVPEGGQRAALHDLPIGVLPIAGDTVARLAGFALDTVGDLLRMPRSVLAARCGDALVARLAEALGEAPAPLLPEPVDTRLRVLLPLDGPTDRRDALLFCLKRMTDALHERLRHSAEGARQVRLRLERVSADQPPLTAELRLSVPQRRAAVLFELLREQLDRCDLTHPVDEIEVCVLRREPLANETHSLFADESEAAGTARTAQTLALGGLLDRLREHLGPEAVLQWRLVENHVPEQAYEVAPPEVPHLRGETASTDAGGSRHRGSARGRGHGPPARPPQSPRPPRVLDPPVAIHLRELGERLQFEYAGQVYDVVQRTGPERIQTEWWCATATSRDYLLLHTAQGPLFWVYRTPDPPGYYLHGVFE